MFSNNKRNDNHYQQQQQNPYDNMAYQKILYELEEVNRKLRNLNNRLRRVEGFLGLRNDDKYDLEIYKHD